MGVGGGVEVAAPIVNNTEAVIDSLINSSDFNTSPHADLVGGRCALQLIENQHRQTTPG